VFAACSHLGASRLRLTLRCTRSATALERTKPPLLHPNATPGNP
jgi:hypothetical protein